MDNLTTDRKRKLLDKPVKETDPPPLPTQTQTAHQISYDAVDNKLPKISERISTTRLQMKKNFDL